MLRSSNTSSNERLMAEHWGHVGCTQGTGQGSCHG